MLRGKQVLYSNIYQTDTSKPERKGHRNVFIDLRDECLAYRFHYYVQFHKKDYKDVLKHLEVEFFITENVIVQRLTPYAHLLKHLKESEITPIVMRKKYPHLVWAA